MMTSEINSVNTAMETTTLPVMEHFYTLQGEGFYQGKAAYFVRLGGCDVGCVWCDVKESWDALSHPRVDMVSLIQEIKTTDTQIVVITGGEPLLHNLDKFTGLLKAAGLQTNIETSGSSKMSGEWDWVCLSPKKFKAPLPQNIRYADELKVIVYNSSDFAWAEKFARQCKPGCKFYLQPEWSRAHELYPVLVEYIKKNPKWELSIQMHKYINVP